MLDPLAFTTAPDPPEPLNVTADPEPVPDDGLLGVPLPASLAALAIVLGALVRRRR